MEIEIHNHNYSFLVQLHLQLASKRMKWKKSTLLTADSTETSHELATLLGLVRDNLQCGAEHFVVVCQPLEQRLRLDQFHLHPALQSKITFELSY